MLVVTGARISAGCCWSQLSAQPHPLPAEQHLCLLSQCFSCLVLEKVQFGAGINVTLKGPSGLPGSFLAPLWGRSLLDRAGRREDRTGEAVGREGKRVAGVRGQSTAEWIQARQLGLGPEDVAKQWE